MRVLFMITRDWQNPAAAGGDTVPWEYARYLASVGHSITYLTSTFPGAAQEDVVEGIRVVRLGGVLSLWFRSFAYYMRHCRGKYDVVVAEGFGGSRIPRLAPLYVREPVITEWHQIHRDLFASQYPKPLVPFLNLLERSTAFVHRNTLVRAGTREWQHAFPTIGFKKENVFLLPVSIQEQWLSNSRAGSVTQPRIIWLGKFRRYKCPHHVVQALKDVVKEVPQARLIMAGRHDDRQYEERLQSLADEAGIAPNTEFKFNITEEEKKALLAGCRVMILPSSIEGFGVVVLEANACGLPVIASSGVPESVVQHGYNGLRYPFGDIAALSRCISQVLKDDALYARLSDNSLDFVQQFAWHKVGAQFEDVVKAAAERRRKAARPRINQPAQIDDAS